MLRILFIFVAIFFVFVLIYFFRPISTPHNIFVSNITDRQATVSWLTPKATKSELLILENDRFPLLPFFVKNWQKDDRDRQGKKINNYFTHQITVAGLNTKKSYELAIYQGLRKVYQGKFSTAPTLATITAPNPVYGRVLTGNKKVGAPQVLIYFQVVNGKEKSNILSTLTNKEGRWSIDLGNLRTFDLKKPFRVGKTSKEQIIVSDGLKNSYKADSIVGKDKPWPDITLISK